MFTIKIFIFLVSILTLQVLVATAHGTLKQCPDPINGDDDVNTDDDYGKCAYVPFHVLLIS